MKKILFPLMFLSVVIASCSKSDDNGNTTPTPNPNGNTTTDMTKATVERTTNNSEYQEAPATLPKLITSNTVLKKGKVYILAEFTFVLNGATIKIEPGVTIKGLKSGKGTLIITRNGKIDAQGTAAEPIVFTSNEATPNSGDWGGVILLGNALTNGVKDGIAGLQAIEGGVNETATGYGLHGGKKSDDNSGIMKYVRIEYPGIAFATNDEINGLTFGSVGSGTTIDYVQVSHSGDDSFEWFGGSVNCKHLIAYRGTDDDFDTDNGFSGKIQFGISLRDAAIADFGPSGASNGFESDNDADGSEKTPQTSAVFSNMTIVGPLVNAAKPADPFKRGAHIRRNSSLSVFNSVFIGWPVGLFIDGTGSESLAASTALQYKNNVIAGCPTVITPGKNENFNLLTWLNTAVFANRILVNSNEALLTNTGYTTFDPTPATGSPLLTGADFTKDKLSGGAFTTTTYVGAAAAGDTWFKGWTKFANK
ncbi:hypothetical protein [Chitinophaga nivalis]|uniref:T9SS C-terminal target domain-containing protein n=1 Tax=Chitinophaga nivalis TaxID=2991709 RepID=A0ABT3IUK3_9BACT|nr:hypothetical protein [Chitinophaga nivalis]MCW3462920.1 hypothetical protein [Chitinophaga nivalis]MCW3487390.1 hypothetical protein [Chitinophaga nivalis]